MNEYVTYEDLKTYLDIANSDIADDTLLKHFCTTASRMWDSVTRRVFYPHIETRYYDMPYDDSLLVLDDDLLEVTTFTTQNDDETVGASDYYLMCGRSYNLTPYNRISMKSDGTRPNLLYSGSPQKSQKIVGTWGYHEGWSDAWQDSNDANVGSLTASATSITVSDVDGEDVYGVTPRFEAQMLLEIDDEYLYVTRTNTSTNILTIRRGVNGTTAAIHDDDTTIYVYQVMDDVAQAVTRFAAWLYAQKDTPFSEQMASVEVGGIVTIPQSAPADVRLMASMYKRLEIG